MTNNFRIDNKGTLVEYLGERKSFFIYRDGDLISEITSFYKENIQQITIPKIREVGLYAFKGCHALKTIIFQEGLVALPLGSLWDCKNLENLWIPQKSLRHFSADALPIRDKKVTLHVNYSRGAWNVLKRAGFVLRRIPKDLWASHSGLFIALKMSYQRLVDLNLHVWRAEELGNREFLGMPIDCTVTFHDDIRAKHLFQRSMPSTVVIEKGVSYIDDDAFLSGGEVYFEGTSIERIDVVEENPYFYSKEGVLFDRDHALRRFAQGKILPDNKYILPDDTQTVVAGAFDGAYTIETLVIPEGVVLLENALVNMPKLDAIWKERRTEA